MTRIMRSILKWQPIIFLIICTLLFQGLSGRPRMRHSHRKLRCSKCPPGWGVASPCTAREDTQCSRCVQGQYSPHHSFHNPCWVCSRCGTGLFEAHPCGMATDTVCDNCNRQTLTERNLSADFYGKCKSSANVTNEQKKTKKLNTFRKSNPFNDLI